MGDMAGFFGDVMKMGIGLEMMRSMGDVMKDAMNSGSQAGVNMSQAMNMAGAGTAEAGGMGGTPAAGAGGGEL